MPQVGKEAGNPVALSRHKARENAFIALFSTAFGNTVEEAVELAREESADYALDDFARGLLRLYALHASAVDYEIESKLKGWNVARLQKVNLSILRLAVAEMLFGDVPGMDSVIINEAVELAKRFGDEPDYQFVNGVLGTISREKSGSGTPGQLQTQGANEEALQREEPEEKDEGC